MENLHTHTTTSDGELSYLSALKLSDRLGIEVLAFTDHDSLPSESHLRDLRNSKNNCDWICGIEVSSGLPIELGGGAVSAFHILGIFVDITNKELIKHCILAQKSRISRMRKMVNNLNNLGFKITEKDCIEISKGEAIGRPHIVQAIKKHSENQKIIRSLYRKMEEEAKSNESVKKRFEIVKNKGLDNCVYDLFLSSDAYIGGVYEHYEYWLDMDSTVSLIRNAGGLAILAHYHTIADTVNGDLLENIVRDSRLDGAETVFEMNFFDEANVADARLKISGLVKKYDKLETGGGDLHTKSQFDFFAAADWFNSKTIGMTDRLISKSNVDLSWSSFSD